MFYTAKAIERRAGLGERVSRCAAELGFAGIILMPMSPAEAGTGASVGV